MSLTGFRKVAARQGSASGSSLTSMSFFRAGVISSDGAERNQRKAGITLKGAAGQRRGDAILRDGRGWWVAWMVADLGRVRCAVSSMPARPGPRRILKTENRTSELDTGVRVARVRDTLHRVADP